MSTLTTHYSLVKPNGAAGGDLINIGDLNGDMDTIDTQMFNNAQNIATNTTNINNQTATINAQDTRITTLEGQDGLVIDLSTGSTVNPGTASLSDTGLTMQVTANKYEIDLYFEASATAGWQVQFAFVYPAASSFVSMVGNSFDISSMVASSPASGAGNYVFTPGASGKIYHFKVIAVFTAAGTFKLRYGNVTTGAGNFGYGSNKYMTSKRYA